MPAQFWYANSADNVVGPVTTSDLITMIEQGLLSGDDQVRAGETGEWSRIRHCPRVWSRCSLNARQRNDSTRISIEDGARDDAESEAGSMEWQDLQELVELGDLEDDDKDRSVVSEFTSESTDAPSPEAPSGSDETRVAGMKPEERSFAPRPDRWAARKAADRLTTAQQQPELRRKADEVNRAKPHALIEPDHTEGRPDAASRSSRGDRPTPKRMAIAEINEIPSRHFRWFDHFAWSHFAAMLLLVPLMVSGPVPHESTLQFGWPRIHSGNEPHYLVQLSSLVQDGDLDVSNNYAASHTGAADAGRSFAGQPLDHHVIWRRGRRVVHWGEAYEVKRDRWTQTAKGWFVPTVRDDRLSPQFYPDQEYSLHSAGLPLCLVPFAFAFRNTAGIETVALIVTALAVVVGMYSFNLLLGDYIENQSHRLAIVTTAFLGTPVWFYARALYPEPYLMTLAIGSYLAVLRFCAYRTAGVLIAVGTLLAPEFVVLAIPLLIRGLVEPDGDRRASDVVHFGVPVVAGVLAACMINKITHGEFSLRAVPWESENVLLGMFGQLFSLTHGLIMTAPVALVALACWSTFVQQYRCDSVILALAILLYVFTVSIDPQWWGGYCYGPRRIVPIVPFMFVSLVSLQQLMRGPTVSRAVSWGFGVLLAVSIAFNGIAAVGCGFSLGSHPIAIVTRWLN